MDSLELDLADLKTGQEARDDEERKGRIKRLIIILLLLLLLLFGIVLAFLVLYSDLFRQKEDAPGIDMLFSLFGFDRPLGVSTDQNGRIIVSDTGNSRMVLFDSTGRYLSTIRGEKKKDKLYGVTGSYYDDEAGRLYVAEFRRRAITVYDKRGKRVDRFPDVPGAPPYGQLGFSPFDIAEYKNRLYVTSNNGIFVFTKKGKLVKDFAGRGPEIDQFDYPMGIVIDKQGTIFVADQLNRRVKAITQKGTVKWVLGGPDDGGKTSSFFSLPRGIALDNKERLFVVDSFHHDLIALSTDGRLLGTVASRGVEDAHLNFPEGIDFRPDGVLYIADRENNRVQAWRIIKLREPGTTLLNKYKKYFVKTKG